MRGFAPLRLSQLLLAALAAAACERIPSEWNSGEVRSFYDRGDVTMVQEIIAQNGKGRGDHEYFPWSVNLLVRRGLAGDAAAFDEAELALSAMDAQVIDFRYDAYHDMLPMLRDGALEPKFANTGSGECTDILERLRGFNEDSMWHWYGVAGAEATYWYSLYANARCTTPEARAIQVHALAEIDSRAAIELLATLRAKFGAAEVDGSLCAIRSQNKAYELTGARSLEDSRALQCTPPVRERPVSGS